MNLTQADVQQLSCNVLLSALSIMPYDVSEAGHTEAELDIEKDRSIRMATILGFKVVCDSLHLLLILQVSAGHASLTALPRI